MNNVNVNLDSYYNKLVNLYNYTQTDAVAAPCEAQGVPRNTLTWKEKKKYIYIYIVIKIFYIWSVLGTPSITKLGTPLNFFF